MYSLIKYRSGSFDTSSTKKIHHTNGKYSVKHRSGRYEVNVLFSHDNFLVVNKILHELKDDKWKVSLHKDITYQANDKNGELESITRAEEVQSLSSANYIDSSVLDRNIQKIAHAPQSTPNKGLLHTEPTIEDGIIYAEDFQKREESEYLTRVGKVTNVSSSNFLESSELDSNVSNILYGGQSSPVKRTSSANYIDSSVLDGNIQKIAHAPQSTPNKEGLLHTEPTIEDGIYAEDFEKREESEYLTRVGKVTNVSSSNFLESSELDSNVSNTLYGVQSSPVKRTSAESTSYAVFSTETFTDIRKAGQIELNTEEVTKEVIIDTGDKIKNNGNKSMIYNLEPLENILIEVQDNQLLKELQTWDNNELCYLPDQCNSSTMGTTTEINQQQNAESTHSSSRSTNKRKLKKKHNCLYCNKLTTTLTRHLRSKHANEPEVQMAIEKAAEEIRTAKNKCNRIAIQHDAFANIRKLGDLKYNQNKNVEENVIVVRNNYVKENITEDYVVCQACKGYYSAKNFRNHRNKQGKCKRMENEKKQNLLGAAKVASLKIPSIACHILKENIFPHFTKPQQKEIIFYDPVLIAFGNSLCTKYFQTSASSQNYKHISSNLRLLSDIFIEAKNIDSSITQMDDLLYSKRRELVMKAIRKRCRFKEDGFEAPSTALESCNLLAKVASLMHGAALDEENRELAQRYCDFETNLRKQQNIHITRAARENRMSIQRQKLEILPSTAEILELLLILSNELKTNFKLFEKDQNVTTYTNLAKVLSAQIMVFNRKRPADVHNWQIEEFIEEEEVTQQDLQMVPENDRLNIQSLRRYQTRHKLNKNEAILIDDLGRKALKLLMSHRQKFIDDDKNKYIFAHPKGKRTPLIRADLSLKAICDKYHLDFSRLKSTKLRKHLATSTASLPRDTQKHLSAFMSHNENVHYDIYQNRRTTDVTVVGRILYHASGMNPAGLSVTTEINESNQSIEELPLSANWLNDDDCLDNEDETVCNQENDVQKQNLTENRPAFSSQHQYGKKSYHFPLDVALTKRKQYDISLKKKTPNTVSQAWTSFQKKQIADIFSKFLGSKQVPTISKIQEVMVQNNCALDKSFSKVQAWIRAEISRRNTPDKGQRGWTAEQNRGIRQRFNNYYKLTQKNKRSMYPSLKEIRLAIATVPILKSKTTQCITSKLQNEFKHLLQKIQEDKDSNSDLSDISDSSK